MTVHFSFLFVFLHRIISRSAGQGRTPVPEAAQLLTVVELKRGRLVSRQGRGGGECERVHYETEEMDKEVAEEASVCGYTTSKQS